MLEVLTGLAVLVTGFLFMLNFRYYLFKSYFENSRDSVEGAIMIAKTDDPAFQNGEETNKKDIAFLFTIFVGSLLLVEPALIGIVILLLTIVSSVILFVIDFIKIKWTIRKHSEEFLQNHYSTMKKIRENSS